MFSTALGKLLFKLIPVEQRLAAGHDGRPQLKEATGELFGWQWG
jgi:hypothetical protein